MTSTASNTTNSGGLDRKALRRPDQFAQATGRFFEDIKKHSKLFAAVIVGLLAIGVAATYIVNSKEEANSVAKDALFAAQQTMERETKALAGTPATPNEADPAAQADAVAFRKLDVDAKFPQTVKQLQEVEKNHAKSRAGFDARLALADLYYRHGDIAKAQPWFEKAADSAPNKAEKAFALKGVGYSLESLGKHPEAVQAFEKAVNQGEASFKPELQTAVARNQALAGDAAKARTTYDQVIKDFPESEYAKIAERAKAKLQ